MNDKSKARKETITPKKAQVLLDSMEPDSNRRKQGNYIRYLADCILRGEWKVNGDTIRINNRGHLIDGQHRLCAVILANKSIETWVAYDLSSKIMDTIDGNKKRTASDYLYILGERNTRTLNASIRLYYRYINDNLSLFRGNKGYMLSNKQLHNLLNDNPKIRDSIKYGSKCSHIVSDSAVTFLHYVFSSKDEAQANYFFDSLATGENLSRTSRINSSILCVREKLREIKIRQKERKESISIEYKIALLITAWNRMRQKKKMTLLRFIKEMPEIL